MRLRTLGLVCGLLAMPALLHAQPAASGTAKIGWDQGGVSSAAEAQALTYRYYPDGATTGIVLTGVVCSGTPGGTVPVQCTAPFPAFTPGTHTLTLTAGNLAGESAPSAPFAFVFVVVPSVPANLRIVQ